MDLSLYNAAFTCRRLLKGARQRALQLHFKEVKRDDYLKHRA
jgi:hypothetical protein